MATERWSRIDFGQRLRSELERLGVTEKRLANLIEKSEPSVNSYCNARSLPPLDTLRQISSALRIPMDWLWPEDGNFPAFTQTPLWKLSELSKQLGNYIGDDAGLGKHRDRIVTLVPPRRRFVPVEVRSALTGERETFVVVELPKNYQDVRAIADKEGTIYIYLLGDYRGPAYIRIHVDGSVSTTEDREDTAGTLIVTLSFESVNDGEVDD